jgi:DNA-binding transcriptional regulator of glucitol operon
MNGRLVARRAGIVAVCVVSLAACVGLAWWQWARFESASGTWQNLGYVLQWPLFGLFPAFMFWRLRKLRRERPAEETPARPPLLPAPAAASPAEPAAQPVDDYADDPELAAYNRYLAELNARHQERQA